MDLDSLPDSENVEDRRSDVGPRGVDDPNIGNPRQRRIKADTIDAVNQSARDANSRQEGVDIDNPQAGSVVYASGGGNPYESLRLDSPAEAPASDFPVFGNPYAKIKSELSVNEALDQNPQVTDHLSNFAKFGGHGLIGEAIAETLGLPVDVVNMANEFIKEYPNAAKAAMGAPLIGPALMGAGAIQAAKGDDKPIYAGSGQNVRDVLNKGDMLPTRSPEEEGVHDWAADLGYETGKFVGTNLPFAGRGIVKEGLAEGLSLSKKAWNIFHHEILPSISTGTGAFIGEEVVDPEHKAGGEITGAVLGSARVSALRAATSGVRSAKDWVKSLYTTEPRVARNIAEAATDLPKAMEKLDTQPELSPGAEVPVDIQTEDPGLIALVRTVRDKDRDLSGLYDQQYRATEEALKADAQFSRANYPDTATYLRAKMGQWTQLINRRVQQAVEEAQRAYETVVGDAIPSPVDADKFKNLQGTLARQHLIEARNDMHAVTEAKWAKVDKEVPVSLDPVYDEIGAVRAEHKSRPGESDARYPGDVIDRFFEKEATEDGREVETPRFGPGSRLQDAVDLDSEIQQEIRSITAQEAPDRVRLAYLTRVSKALQKVKEAAPGGEALKEANAATKEFHQTFSRGPVGNILGHDEPGYPRVNPGETISHVISQGSGGVDSFGAFMRAVAQKAGTTAPPEFLMKFLRQDFYDAAMPNGQFNASRAQQWLRNNTGPLGSKGFEKLRSEVEDAIKSQGESLTAVQVRKLDKQKLRQHAVSTFLNEPGKLFSKALHSTQQKRMFEDLLGITEGDHTGQATDGLVQMSFNRMMKDAMEADHATPELQRVRGDRVVSWVEENAGAIDALDRVRPGVKARFERIANTARKNEMHHVNPKIPGITEKAATLALDDIVARVMGARVFTHIFGGHGGSSIQIASIGSQAFKGWAKQLKPDDAIRLLAEAMNDPKLFKALTKHIADEKEAAKQAKILEPYLLSMQIPLIQHLVPNPAPAAQSPEKQKNP